MTRAFSTCCLTLISVLALLAGCGGDKVNFSPPDVAVNDSLDDALADDDAPADATADTPGSDIRPAPDSADVGDVTDANDAREAD